MFIRLYVNRLNIIIIGNNKLPDGWTKKENRTIQYWLLKLTLSK